MRRFGRLSAFVKCDASFIFVENILCGSAGLEEFSSGSTHNLLGIFTI